eukprot:431602_1
MATDIWPTYLMLALYIASMLIVTYIANRQNAASMSKSRSNMVKTHFLASKSFGTVVLFLTTFASVFSGYTVVGVPNEAGFNGFTSIRWFSANFFGTAGMIMIFPRIRRLSMVREYSSPGDFVYDRYRSNILRVFNTFCLSVPQIVYITVQLHALGATLQFFTNDQLPFNVVVIASGVLILIFEALGGMRTVAYTDMVQAIIMFSIFISFPIVLGLMYGAFEGQVVNSKDLPCPNSQVIYDTSGNMILSGCLNYMQGPKTEKIASEFYLRKPSTITIINYVLFSASVISFVINPHVLQRAMVASHDWQVRNVLLIMICMGYVCQIPGILIGISYLSNWNSFQPPQSTYPAFQSILGIFQNIGGFRAFLSYFAMIGAVAGIMSTADSALIGVSNCFCCDLFKNWLTPNISSKGIVWIGKTVSFITMGIAMGIAINLQTKSDQTGEPVSYGVLLLVQQGILWQAFPAYIFGLYTNISWKSILFGMIVGVTVTIILTALVFSEQDPFIQWDPAFESLDSSWSALIGVFLNLICCAGGHCIFDSDDRAVAVAHSSGTRLAHKSFYDLNRLSIHKIRDIMEGISEPITKYRGIFVWLYIGLSFLVVIHWIGEVDPELIEIYGTQGAKQLLYNGYVQNVVAGFPQWLFQSMIWYAVATVLGLIATLLWNVDVKHEGKMTISSAVEMEYSVQSETGDIATNF